MDRDRLILWVKLALVCAGGLVGGAVAIALGIWAWVALHAWMHSACIGGLCG